MLFGYSENNQNCFRMDGNDKSHAMFRDLAEVLTRLRQMPTGKSKKEVLSRFIKDMEKETVGIVEDLLRCADNEDLNSFRTGLVISPAKNVTFCIQRCLAYS